MQHFRNILVGVDLSHGDRIASSELNAPTKEAISQSIWLSSKLGARLTFLSAIELSAAAEECLKQDAEAFRTVEEDARRVLDELVADAGKCGVTAGGGVVHGKAWVEIIHQVLRHGHDLVVVGTRDLNAAGRIFLGGTGMKLLRNCPCPVWVTKPGPEREVSNLLVASDLSEVSQHALEIAVNGGQLMDVRLHLLHALEGHEHRGFLTGSLSREKLAEIQKRRRAEIEAKLQAELARTDYRTLTHGVQVHIIEGPADQVIEDAIKEFDIDLLVMGTVGRHGIPGMLVGNTAERVLPHVTCSVLAVKPAEFACPITL